MSEMSVTLETERLYLRPWTDDDAEALFELAKDPDVGPAAGWPAHKSVEESRDIIHNVLSAPETYASVCKEDGRLIGSVGLKFGEDSTSEKQDEPELGYWIGKPFWGNGYATEAAHEMILRAFMECHAAAVWCCHYEGNERSFRVIDKCCFRYVRTNPEGDTLLGYHLPELEYRIAKEEFFLGGSFYSTAIKIRPKQTR